MVDENDGDADNDGERNVHRVVVTVEAHEERGREAAHNANQRERRRPRVQHPDAREQSRESGVAREDEGVTHVHIPWHVDHINNKI